MKYVWRPARGTLAAPRTLSDQTIRSLSWDAESYFGYSEYPSRSSFSSYCSSIIDGCGSELEFRQRNAPPRRGVSRCLIFVLFLDDDRVIIRFVLLYNRGAALSASLSFRMTVVSSAMTAPISCALKTKTAANIRVMILFSCVRVTKAIMH